MNAGELIAAARRDAGWSQARLAAAAGITQAALSRIETGRSTPALDTLEALAAALGRTLVVGLRPAANAS